MGKKSEYYVYVYIDPRNFEEFYYGKGKGDRKYEQLNGNIDTARAKRINDIRKAGQEPIIKVIASNLTEEQAFLIEATLIWKSDSLNKVAGHYKRKFRPQNTMHLNLPKFDFQNGFYFVNVGEDEGDKSTTRNWEDNRNYNFISAGQGEKWSRQIKSLKKGDLIAAYFSKRGYVGIGIVESEAIMIKDFKFQGKYLESFKSKLNNPNVFLNCDNPNKSEWVIAVKWIRTAAKKEAKWREGLFRFRSIKASLANQKKTIDFLEKEFNFKIGDLT